jgi:hypothetical protein
MGGYLADGTKIVARATIYATGVAYRRLDLPHEERFQGTGLYMAPARAKPPWLAARMSLSSEAATRPARRPCTSRRPPARSQSLFASNR